MTQRIILSLMIACISCNAQVKTEVWLPEKYVEAFVDKDTTGINQLLWPIESFIIFDGKIQMLTYRGEISPVETEMVKQNGKVWTLLHNVHYYINQKYVSKDIVARFSHAQFLLSRQGDKLILEIREPNAISKIYFVNRVQGYEFKEFRESKRFLANLLRQ